MSLLHMLDQPAGGGDAPKLDPVALVVHASIPVKAVLVILVLFSVICWLVIGAKALHLSRARGESERFLKTFDQATSFDTLAQGLAAFRGSPFARIFAVGYDEMDRMTHGQGGTQLDEAQSTHVESATRRAAAQEVTHLEIVDGRCSARSARRRRSSASSAPSTESWTRS